MDTKDIKSKFNDIYKRLDDISELKSIIYEQSQRISTLETILRNRNEPSYIVKKRPVEELNKIIVLGSKDTSCLCGLQAEKDDEVIPIVELNMYNLEALIIKIRDSLSKGEKTCMLECYKKYNNHAKVIHNRWCINEDEDYD